VIVGTANHYWLDAIAATVLLGVALAVIRPPRRTETTEVRAEELVGAGGGVPDASNASNTPDVEADGEVPELVGAGR
jgi:hypothetical protein